MTERESDDPPRIGWWRAILTAVAITAIGIVVLVTGVNAVLTRFADLDRSARVAIATCGFFIALAALAWALRRLQQRGAI